MSQRNKNLIKESPKSEKETEISSYPTMEEFLDKHEFRYLYDIDLWDAKKERWKRIKKYDPAKGTALLFYSTGKDNQKQDFVEIKDIEKLHDAINGFDPDGDVVNAMMEKREEELREKNKIISKKSKKVNKVSPKELESMRKRDVVRAAADYTINKFDNDPSVKSYEELNASNKEEGDKKFNEITRKLWKDFAVHGIWEKDKQGKKSLKIKTDLDGQAFIFLFKQAGLDVSDVKYLEHEDKYRRGGISGDMSGEHGVVLKIDGEEISLIIDHHSEESKRDSSTAKFTYELLVEYGLLKKSDDYQKFVDYVTFQDNQTHYDPDLKELFNAKKPNADPSKVKYLNKYSRTIMGLQNYLTAEQVFELLGKVKDFRKDELPKDILKNFKVTGDKAGEEKTLLEISRETAGKMDNARRDIAFMKRRGFSIETGKDRHGEVLIDTGNLVIGDQDGKELIFNKIPPEFRNLPARAADCGGYVVWKPEVPIFQVYTTKPYGDLGLSRGFDVRGNYWLYHGDEGEKLEPEMLEEILSKLTGKEYKIDGALKDAMESEEKEREILRDYGRQFREIKGQIENIFNADDFTKEKIGEKESERAGELRKEWDEIISGKIGKKKQFQNWGEKIEALKEVEKKIKDFIDEVKEKSQFSEAEMVFIKDFYVVLAKDIAGKVRNHYTVENGYKQEKIAERTDEEMDRFWKKLLPEKMKKDGKIREEKIEIAIQETKKIIEEEKK